MTDRKQVQDTTKRQPNEADQMQDLREQDHKPGNEVEKDVKGGAVRRGP